MIKLCFSTLGCTDKSLSEVISIAKRFDISALEIRGLDGELNNEKIPDFLPKNAVNTRRMLEDACIFPLILGTSASFHEKEAYDKNISDAKNAIRIASRVGFSAIRVFGNIISGDENEIVLRVANGVRDVCLFAEEFKVSVLLEVHGDFNTVERLLPIADLCRDLKSFGIIWDVCHTHERYGKKWSEFYDPLAPYIRHVHFKDVKNGKHVLPGDGELPLIEVAEYMIKKGYDGYFSLEWEKYWRKELPEIEIALEKLVSLFDQKTSN